MAYFDSPKNRALWEKEMASLRRQKELRIMGIDPSVNSKEEKDREIEQQRLDKMINESYREKTSYKELLIEEAAEIKSKRINKSKSLKMSKTNEKKPKEKDSLEI